VEKGHPEVLDLFLPAFDEGYLTDARGKKSLCKQVVFIMTSNLGAAQLQAEMLERQAAAATEAGAEGMDAEAVEAIVQPVVQQRMRPELLGRVDGTAFFRPLVPADIRRICEMTLAELGQRVLEASGGRLSLQCDAGLVEFCAQQAIAAPQYGARGVQREVQQKVARPLSKLMLHHRLESGDAKHRLVLHVEHGTLAARLDPGGQVLLGAGDSTAPKL
jgi:ATP-dependent Clp protease ATP-binding subunit ClpC